MHSTLTLSPLLRATGAEGSSTAGLSSLGGNPDRRRCWSGGMPSSCWISCCKSEKEAVGERERLAALPSDTVTRILLLDEGEGGEGLGRSVSNDDYNTDK